MLNSRIIGIVGARKRNSQEDLHLVVEAFYKVYKNGDVICSGGCPTGADSFAKLIHIREKIPYLEFPANWNLHGKSAGYIRNKLIAEASDILIAMVTDESEAKGGTYRAGTESTIRTFKTLQAVYGKKELIIL